MFYKAKKQMIRLEPKGQTETTKLSFGIFLDGILTLVVLTCFLLSVRWCFSDVFPNFAISAGFVLTRIFLAIPIVVLFEMVCRFQPEFRGKIHLIVSVVYLVGHVVVYLARQDSISSGSIYFGKNYVQLINFYYKINLTFDSGVRTYYGPYAMEFWFSALFFFLLLLSYFSEKRMIMGLFPLLILILEMLVGLTPEFKGVAFGFAGTILAGCGGWGSLDEAQCRSLSGRKYPELIRLSSILLVLIMAVFIPKCSQLAFSDTANKLASSAGTLKSFQKMVEMKLDSFSLFSTEKNQEAVNNRTPHYKYKEVLQLTIKTVYPQSIEDALGEEQISSSVSWSMLLKELNDEQRATTRVGGTDLSTCQYLRGFYGVDYVNGVWVGDSDSFSDACEESGYETGVMTRFVAQQASAKLEKMEWDSEQIATLNTSSYGRRSYTLKYTGLKSNRGYLPYFLDGNSEEVLSELEADVSLNKLKNTDKLTYAGWNADLGNSSLLYALSNQEELEVEELDNWYNHYVQNHYLGTASEDVPAVEEAALAIQNSQYQQALDDGKASVRNEARICYANEVSDYLSEGEYSLELDRISDGSDALQYFLAKSRKGYCVHFASAGVLILRSLGVPARYASGYAATADEFDYNEEDGSYTASILDSDAHAWAEIYLDDIGWVPIEMTPSNRSRRRVVVENDNPGSEGNSETMEKTDYEQEDPDELQQNTLEGQNEYSSQQNENKDPVNTEEEKGTENRDEDAAQKSDKSPKGAGTGEADSSLPAGSWKNLLKGIGIVLCMIVVVLLWAAITAVLQKRHAASIVDRELLQKKNRKAIKEMNRRIYRTVCRRQRLFRKWLSDEEYEKIFMRAFPDIKGKDLERFMALVKKAHFSLNEITDEEAEFCHNIYLETLSGKN